MKIVVTDLLRKVEIETQPGELPPTMLSADFSELQPGYSLHRIRVDCVAGQIAAFAPTDSGPTVAAEQPAAPAVDVPQHIRVAEWEACEPGHQAVS